MKFPMLASALALVPALSAPAWTQPPSKRLSPPGWFCQFGSYDCTPESPDGRKIVFTRYDKPPVDNSFTHEGAVYVSNADGSDVRRVVSTKYMEVHNGAGAYFVTNDILMARFVWDGKIAGVAAVRTDGTILHGPFTHATVQHHPHGTRALIEVKAPDKSPFAPNLANGIWILDVADGKLTQVVKPADFLPFKDRMPGSDDASRWNVEHATWNPGGTLISIRLMVPDAGNTGKDQMFSFKADGSDKVHFGVKPTHFGWHDDNTLWGNDGSVNDGKPDNSAVRVWTRDGKWIRDLTDFGNHTAMSPDKRLFATDTDYHSNPVKVFLKKAGGGTLATLMEHPFPKLTWTIRLHTNPSFSRSGTKVFYNKALSDASSECWVSDISAYAQATSLPGPIAEASRRQGMSAGTGMRWFDLNGVTTRHAVGGGPRDKTLHRTRKP